MLIVDMPMPSRCGECPLFYMDIVTCTVTGKDCTEYGAERPSWCPIKGVLPDEHGDLIDRDELLKCKGDCYDFDGHLLYAVGTGTILRMKTVIAAERSEK